MIDGAANCASCETGYHLQSDACVENMCTCESGSAATGSDCLTDGLAMCVSCNSGFDLQSNVCTTATIQYLMYTMMQSQTVYSYTLDIDRPPLKMVNL